MIERYNPKAVETKWKEIWKSSSIDSTNEDETKPKWYALTMFVYPSGDIHAGHWYAFTPSDAAARWRRMNGYNVFFPVGFDAFGLPAENAAIKRNVHPKDWTYANIDRMRDQLRNMGAMWAWDREAVTCDPQFYRWSQWFFLRLYEAGLAYREYAPVDWCPSCNTTLAREQVWGEDRHCERCRTPVIKKNLEQWKFRITKYADELVRDLDSLAWPERVKIMQRNWIGRSEGALVQFDVDNGAKLEVFTTRPDTLWGATFIVLAPEHPLVDTLMTEANRSQLESYRSESATSDEIERTASNREKTGVFTGFYATNPANGERMPIWVSDYVVMGYGTGAIMGVPAHDERDYDFAEKYNLTIQPVIVMPGIAQDDISLPYSSKEDGVLVNSGQFNGLPVKEAIEKITAWLEETGKGTKTVSYRLHDWLISRQRMWGAPIPIIYCDNCGTVPVPYESLPVTLPDDAEFKPTGESPLKYHKGFRYVKCPQCGGDAERETDTMDTFMCSSWYQYAYVSPYHLNGETISRDSLPWNKLVGDYWLPVDQYTGGIEHATMHLLYTRFFTKAMRDIGLVNFDEPMNRLFNQGMILGPDGEKMSKSRGNVINPDDYVQKYGADTVRGYMMFIGPWDQGGPWDPSAIEGVHRFLHRVWNLLVDDKVADGKPTAPSVDALRTLERRTNQLIIKVSDDISNFRFNTVIASLMEFTNYLYKERGALSSDKGAWSSTLHSFLLLMAPIFPFISEELWHRLGNTDSIHLQTWPKADIQKAKEEFVEVVVQINGKNRDRLSVSLGTPQAELEQLAKSLSSVQTRLEGREIRKVIVVPDKLVNIVIS